MKSNKLAAVFGTILATTALASLPPLEVQTRDYPQAEGSYTAGTLVSADRFTESTEYTVKIHAGRESGYASQDMVTLIESAARGIRQLFPKAERVQAGDFSFQHGGEIDGHGSHENGLDVDLAYFRTDARELPPTSMDFPDEYVVGGKLLPVFDIEKNLRFFELLVSSGRINRIFVDPVIKVRLCEHAAKFGEKEKLKETLRRLRPWPRHGDHFHVRLTCPKASTNCVPQAPVAEGDGCAEAKGEAARMYPAFHQFLDGADAAAASEAAVQMFELEKQASEGPGC